MKTNCINTACKMATTCVHAIEYNKVAKEQESITSLNPKSQNFDEEGKCQYYRALRRVVYAYGFEGEMSKMTQPVYKAFTQTLIRTYSRTYFYDIRNGKKPISPAIQQKIIAVASTLGYDFPPDAWDRIEEAME